jgi:hypothetical protein
LNVWQESSKRKHCLNQTFLYHWKALEM